MELTDLKVFKTVAEEGNVSRAAERLDYVQSNVTSRIRKLESELGTELFHRLPRGVSLTEKGNAFLEYAKIILSTAEEAVRVVRESEEPAGPLTIGVVETVSVRTLTKLLSDYRQLYPKVSLSLIAGSSPELFQKVLNGEVDGAFVTGEAESSRLTAEYVITDEVVLVSGENGGRKPDFRNETWVLFPTGCPFRLVTEKWLRHSDAKLNQKIETSSLETLLNCVRSGLGVTLLPMSVLSGESGFSTVRFQRSSVT